MRVSTNSWVTSANGHPDFPISNLPYGVFSRRGEMRRGGVAIGDELLDVSYAITIGAFEGEAAIAAQTLTQPTLNAFFALKPAARKALRERLITLLSAESGLRDKLADGIYSQSACCMHLPAQVGDYTDFYVGIQHATNVGQLFRPENPLLPNYKYVPIGYHGRSSTLGVSGNNFKRPNGQTLPSQADTPIFGPCQHLDFELELGIWIGSGNTKGSAVAVQDAHDHVIGLCLLNDWSARDIQTWEYQPLGPFLSKNFATTVSPWVVTIEALEPFRCPQPRRPKGDPLPLEYLYSEVDQAQGAYDIELEVLILTSRMRDTGMPPERITLSNTKHMYWTVAQMVAHHTVNGCSLAPGDLFGTGTLSGPTPSEYGSLLEITSAGKKPFTLSNGEQRCFLLDGDEIILRGRCNHSEHPSIGFGECRARVLPH